MTPTAKFRWLEFHERTIGDAIRNAAAHPSAILNKNGVRVRVLQQWWEIGSPMPDGSIFTQGEWRDIPIEEQA